MCSRISGVTTQQVQEFYFRLVLGCSRAGRGRANACYLSRETAKINCPATISLKLRQDRWLHIDYAKLDHNHPLNQSSEGVRNSLSTNAKRRGRPAKKVAENSDAVLRSNKEQESAKLPRVNPAPSPSASTPEDTLLLSCLSRSCCKRSMSPLDVIQSDLLDAFVHFDEDC